MQVSSYDLFIDLDFVGLTFNGRVQINLKSDGDVVLNSAGLKILRAASDGREFQFKQVGEDLTLSTGAFDGILRVDYTGVIPDSLAGIYRAPYDNTHIVTTHFEAAQARRMLPCVDRPDVKAEFKLTIETDKDLNAISNMPVESVSTNGMKKTISFQKTPRMSTYLLYLGVGKFEEHSDKLYETNVVMATVPGKVKLAGFALDETKKAIKSFESYYAIPYMLPKIHLIAVPEFAVGAMENWGAITFRESALLLDANSSNKAKKRISEVVIHELAHQWFGDLVTMKWWDDIWLNESFATFMSFIVVDGLHPQWKIWDDFLRGQTSGAAARDALQHTHPVETHVTSPEEIEQIFDDISYGKGASILRMVEAFIGKDVFRNGIRQYLTKFAYTNASGNDLWSSLEDASGKKVKKIMTAWVRKPGFPVVTASMNDGKLKLRQDRFLISGASEKEIWPIPINMEINGQPRNLLLEEQERTIDVGQLESLRMNLDRTGFFVVRYVGLDDALWSSNLTATDRWGIVADAFAFLISGLTEFSDYLRLLERLLDEEEFLPAHEISDQLGILYILLPSAISEISRKFHRSQLQILRNQTDENSSILRGAVAARLALVDDDYARELAVKFEDYGRVEPDMRQAVAFAYARAVGDFDKLLEAYRATSSDEEKTRILSAMTAFRNAALVKRTLDFSLSGEVKRQDIRTTVLAAAGKAYNQTVTWEWLRENVERLREFYRGTGILSGTLLAMIPILGIGRVQECETFFREHKMPEAEVGISAGLEKLQAYNRLVNKAQRAV
jgi:tricorn protease interacting factor F2/3